MAALDIFLNHSHYHDMSLTSIAALAGLAFGFVGTSLGIFNTWRASQKDKVKLKVIPKIYCDLGTRRLSSSRIPLDASQRWHGLCIEIVNISFFPVTIEEVGILRTDSDVRSMFQPELSGNESLPKRLEPRTAFTAYIPSPAPEVMFQMGLPGAKCFYATTACGVTVQGSSAVSKWLIRLGKRKLPSG
jgi:hypothetical protein